MLILNNNNNIASKKIGYLNNANNKLNLNNEAVKNTGTALQKEIKFKGVFSRLFVDFPNWLKVTGTKNGINFSEMKVSDIVKTIVPQEGNTKWIKRYEDFGTAAAIGVVAQAAKDAFNCLLYVRADLANKKIPKEKRQFQTALDAVNGICSTGLQLVCGFLILSSTAQEYLMNKIFPKGSYFEEKVREEVTKKTIFTKVKNFFNPKYTEKLTEDGSIVKAFDNAYNAACKVAKESAKKALSSGEEKKIRADIFEKLGKITEEKVNARDLTKGFKSITSLVVAAIIAKRIIAYGISTPTASYVKNMPIFNPDNKGKKAPAAKPESDGSKNPPANSSPATSLSVPTLAERLAKAKK